MRRGGEDDGHTNTHAYPILPIETMVAYYMGVSVAGLKEATGVVDGLARDLDGPNVGVGKSLRREEVSEGTNPNQCFEVQCCWTGPGMGGDVMITGIVTQLMKECVAVARDMILIHEERIIRDLGLHVRRKRRQDDEDGSAASGITLFDKTGQDLHVHILSWSDTPHTSYIASMVLAMVSLMSKRRLPEDLGAEGDLDCSGILNPIYKWTTAQVEECKRQGLRRMVVSVKTEFDEGAKEAAAALGDDGKATVEFLPYGNILDALPHIFATTGDDTRG